MEITKLVSIDQKINCAIALNSNSTSYLKDFYNSAYDTAGSGHKAIAYSSSTKFKSLSPYTSGATLFDNVNSADCGDFTACSVKPKGCGSGAYSGNL